MNFSYTFVATSYCFLLSGYVIHNKGMSLGFTISMYKFLWLQSIFLSSFMRWVEL